MDPTLIQLIFYDQLLALQLLLLSRIKQDVIIHVMNSLMMMTMMDDDDELDDQLDDELEHSDSFANIDITEMTHVTNERNDLIFVHLLFLPKDI